MGAGGGRVAGVGAAASSLLFARIVLSLLMEDAFKVLKNTGLAREGTRSPERMRVAHARLAQSADPRDLMRSIRCMGPRDSTTLS